MKNAYFKSRSARSPRKTKRKDPFQQEMNLNGIHFEIARSISAYFHDSTFYAPFLKIVCEFCLWWAKIIFIMKAKKVLLETSRPSRYWRGKVMPAQKRRLSGRTIMVEESDWIAALVSTKEKSVA